jgi:hypothetical protein
VFFVGLIEKVWKIDDPVGAIAVHGVNGMWGQLSVGLFADGLANYGGLQVRGLFFGDVGQFVAQVIGAVTCFVYVFGISWLFFKTYDILFGMRVSPQVELAGLDIPEMGALAYPPDSEPNLQPASVGISAVVAWQQAQLDSVNQQPLPQSLRVASPQHNQTGPSNPNLQGGRINPNYQERPSTPNYQERPSTPNYQERPSTPNYQERPSTPNYQERPSTPNYQERPSTPNYQERPATNPSQPGGNAQSDAWWQNQRSRPRRIVLDSDKQ